MTEKRLLEITRSRPFEKWTGDPMDIPCRETSDAERLCRRPVVSVAMLAYNHEPFVRQAIEGVMMQKTDFEFELVIGEDCSTDKTREICFECQRKFPDKIRVLWSDENLFRHPHPAGGNSRRVRSHCRGEFVAFCEGDDYWTDPTKLQRQVDVMRRHPEVSLCAHAFRTLCDGELASVARSWAKFDEMKKAGGDGDGFKFGVLDCFYDWLWIHTASVMYRRSMFDRAFYLRAKYHCDAIEFYACLHEGVGYFIDREMSVYRIGSQGVYSRMSARGRRVFGLGNAWAIYDADPNEVSREIVRRAARKLEELDFPRCALTRLRRAVSRVVRHAFHLGASGEPTRFNRFVDRIRHRIGSSRS